MDNILNEITELVGENQFETAKIKLEDLLKLVKDGVIKGIETDKGNTFEAENVIVAPGREGADWLATEFKKQKIDLPRHKKHFKKRYLPFTSISYSSRRKKYKNRKYKS